MIRINEQYLYKFKKVGKYSFRYQICGGAYLNFDYETREYTGWETNLSPFIHNFISKKADQLINDLLTKGILEYGD